MTGSVMSQRSAAWRFSQKRHASQFGSAAAAHGLQILGTGSAGDNYNLLYAEKTWHPWYMQLTTGQTRFARSLSKGV